MIWWLISDRLSGMDEASFHCLLCSTLRWSNVPKVFNHAFKPQPLIFHSSPQCLWSDDSDVTSPGLSAGLEGVRLDEIFLQASQEEKKKRKHSRCCPMCNWNVERGSRFLDTGSICSLWTRKPNKNTDLLRSEAQWSWSSLRYCCLSLSISRYWKKMFGEKPPLQLLWGNWMWAM